ncbi:endolytic transglycosylase MltG [Agromyces protaetiae]|uniref:Endolytic murein transglycosylase n=1 Tax=Agromyces protaetiae TaxID=2509455 RepID=A0A4V0YH93_9MICO|nr:endolytic transglycosylase MltG [Agromyces protaetiae]QAY73911.1 endolytic transglycosylase MltG [Agromyces protaetiae]
MTQFPSEPREPQDDRATSDWHALLNGDLRRRATATQTGPTAAVQPLPEAPQSGMPGVVPAGAPTASTTGPSGQPMTRREMREAEQRRQAEAEAAEALANASTGIQAPSPDEAPIVHPELASLVSPETGPVDPARPSRADRRAAASSVYDPHEPEKPHKRRGPWGCLIGLLVVAALVAGAFFFLQGPIASIMAKFEPTPDYTGQGTGEVLFQVHEGDSGGTIGERLVADDVVKSEKAFLEAIDASPTEAVFYPGVFKLASQMSAKSALAALLDDSNRMENTVLLREGIWAKNALAEASAALSIPLEDLQAAASNPQALGLPAGATSVEGFLFPATYTFNPGVTAQEVVQTMIDRSLQEFDAAGVAPDDRLRVATIASLVEREGLPQDFGKVSRVIQNRLDQGMLLQFDSTVHYGIGDDSVVTTTDAERADESNPYNTYVHAGLPPGPIGNPGAAAIAAALNPEAGDWLYFVTVDPSTGETVFTNNIDDHEAAAERFYQWLEDHPDYGN